MIQGVWDSCLDNICPADMRKVVYGSSSTFTKILRVPQNKCEFLQKNVSNVAFTTLLKANFDSHCKLVKL